MKAPRKLLHLLLIISELILVGIALTMIIKYQIIDDVHKIWMGSKILSVENLMKSNNNNSYPMTYIGDTEIFYAYHSKNNYYALLKHSGSSCEENYKKCGILDTMGNIMCIPEINECPINDVIDEETYNKLNNREDYVKSGDLYYSNKKTENSIISKVSYYSYNSIIKESNFVFDYDTYKDLTPPTYSDDDKGYGRKDYHVFFDKNDGYEAVGYDSSSKSGIINRTRKRKLSDTIYGNKETTQYIKERLNDNINKDKSYRKLYNETYGGNYLGFKDYSSLEKFTNLDLYNLYFISFPNKAADIFCYFLAVIFTGMIIYSIVTWTKEDETSSFNESGEVIVEQLAITIPYLMFFIGFFLYIVYEYDNIYIKLRHEELLEIKGDPFFEDLIQEIYDRNPKPYVFFIFITLYIVSLILFILAWILNHCFAKFNKKYPSGRKHPLTSSNFDEEEKKY